MSQHYPPRQPDSGRGYGTHSGSTGSDARRSAFEALDPSHRLPPLTNNEPLQQPVYRLPPANDSRFTTPFYNQDDEHESSAEPSPTGPADDQKRSRACEACRGLKDENEPTKPCKRCAKARRTCVVTAPSRKRQKKSDGRVAELERKIDALTADLRRQKSEAVVYGNGSRPVSPPPSDPPPSRSTYSWKRELEDRVRPRMSAPDIETHMEHYRRNSDVSVDSSIGEGEMPYDSIIDQATATRIFDRFVAEMAQHLPAVMFESDTTAADIRATRPVLFLAILDTASVGMLDLDVQSRLNEMLLHVYASSILRRGEKSLDLVQALMVSTIWYRPPKRYEQMNVYMLTHIAALMALEFGMGRKMNASRNMRVAANIGQNAAPKTFLRSDSVEARRTWLGNYFVCMNVSLSLRRPNFIRWNSYLDECVKVLESAPETLPSDKKLCQHVKLMHINEEVGHRFSMDDPSATIAISDPRVQFAMSAFEQRLTDWENGVPATQWDLALEFSKNFSRLYMHEIALHNNHNIDDFRAPFTEESLKAPSLKALSLTPYHIGLLRHCFEAVHDMFNTFNAFDMVTVKALPIFYFVRIAYAVVVLIKLHNALSDESNIGIEQADLKVEFHLDRLLKMFQRLAQEEAFRPARMFMIIVSKLRDGFKNKNIENQPAAKPELALEVMAKDRKLPQAKRKEKPRAQMSPPAQTSRFDESAQRSMRTEVYQPETLEAQPRYVNVVQDPAVMYAQPETQWYDPTGMMMNTMNYRSDADVGFLQAVEATMSIAEGNLSSIFIDGNYNGYPAGMIPEGYTQSFQHMGGNWPQ